MKRLLSLAGLFAVLAFGCDDCSSRAQADLSTIATLDHVLERNFASSWDGGLAELDRLERELAPALEVSLTGVQALAGSPAVRVTTRTSEVTHITYLTVALDDRAQARRFVSTLLDRGLLLDGVTFRSDGVEVGVSAYDPSAVALETFPSMTPASGDGMPCFTECRRRQQHLIEGRALLSRFTAELPRLYQLKTIERWLTDDRKLLTDLKVARSAFEATVERGLPAGARLRLVENASQLSVCNAGGGLDTCTTLFGANARCTLNIYCQREPVCTDASAPGCGFTVSFKK